VFGLLFGEAQIPEDVTGRSSHLKFHGSPHIMPGRGLAAGTRVAAASAEPGGSVSPVPWSDGGHGFPVVRLESLLDPPELKACEPPRILREGPNVVATRFQPQ
jgi:hypothetical protein